MNEEFTEADGGQLSKIGIDPKLPEFLPLWTKANGVELLSPDGMASQVDDPRVAEALEFAASLHEPAGGRAPSSTSVTPGTSSARATSSRPIRSAPSRWSSGTSTCSPTRSPDVPIEAEPFLGHEGQPITFADGDAFAIVTDSPNGEAAFVFAATMTSADAWIAASRERAKTRAAEGKLNFGVYTGNRQADEVIFGELVDLSTMPHFEDAVQDVLETQEHAFAMPPSPPKP